MSGEPLQTEIDINTLRAETGVPDALMYLNNARLSPCPVPVLKAIEEALENEHRGLWGDDQAGSVMQDLKGSLAQLINASPDEIAITQSASYGINTIINGLSWHKGDNVVVYDLAYRTIPQALMRLRDEKEVELRFVETENLLVDPAAVLAAVDERTRLVIVDHLPVFCGVPQPIAEIGKLLADTPALFVVNATQSTGQLPVDVKEFNCDFLFGTSRKWLRGPRGLGFLYVRQPLIESMRPTNLGYPYTKWSDFDNYETTNRIERLEMGDYPYALIVGLTESIRYAQRIGIGKIRERNQMLGKLCRQTLSQIPNVELYDLQNGKTGTVPFNIRGIDATVTVKMLQDAGIITCVLNEESALRGFRKLNQQRVVRVALHYFNTEDEVDHLAQALRSIGHSIAVSKSI